MWRAHENEKQQRSRFEKVGENKDHGGLKSFGKSKYKSKICHWIIHIFYQTLIIRKTFFKSLSHRMSIEKKLEDGATWKDLIAKSAVFGNNSIFLKTKLQ